MKFSLRKDPGPLKIKRKLIYVGEVLECRIFSIFSMENHYRSWYETARTSKPIPSRCQVMKYDENLIIVIIYYPILSARSVSAPTWEPKAWRRLLSDFDMNQRDTEGGGVSKRQLHIFTDSKHHR